MSTQSVIISSMPTDVDRPSNLKIRYYRGTRKGKIPSRVQPVYSTLEDAACKEIIDNAYEAAREGYVVQTHMALRELEAQLENDSKVEAYRRDVLEHFRNSSTGRELRREAQEYFDDASAAAREDNQLEQYKNLLKTRTYWELLGSTETSDYNYVDWLVGFLEESLQEELETMDVPKEMPLKLEAALNPDTQPGLPEYTTLEQQTSA